jgi:hypothetical protein
MDVVFRLPLADGDPGFVGGDVCHVKIAHDGDAVGVVDAVADEGEDDALGGAAEAKGVGIDLGEPERGTPAGDVDVGGVFAGIDKEEAVGMGEPVLLGGGHGEGFAVVPGPGLFFGPLEAVVAGGDVAARVFGAVGEVKTLLVLGE